MPIVTLPVGSPFPTVGDVMNLARVRVNDVMNDLSGDLLANSSPEAQPILNASWRWLQGKAATAGVETDIRKVVIQSFPVRASDDVANEASISWTGASDGVYSFTQPALPSDMIIPLSLHRRPSYPPNSEFVLMEQATSGMPGYIDTNIYDWHDNAINFFAETYVQDFRLRYAAMRPSLDITLPLSTVPMMMCENCLAERIAFEFTRKRGGTESATLELGADNAFEIIAQRTSRRKQRQTIRRKPYTHGNSMTAVWPNIY
jgi:hypothetical protein